MVNLQFTVFHRGEIILLNKKQLSLLGYASGIAAGNTGCGEGPIVLYKSDWVKQLKLKNGQAYWHALFHPQQMTSKYRIVAEICTRLAQQTQALTLQGIPFSVIGGDHSCAIGTWSGVAQALRLQGDFGLIWVDAHLDSHTPETTESGNIHGMPLAALLGYGAKELIEIGGQLPKLNPQHVCIIGARSYEAGEHALLQKLGVKIFFMEEIKQRGLSSIMQEARAIVKQSTAGYGISIDLDAVDPSQAPGVGSPAPNGLDGLTLCQTLTGWSSDKKFIGCEITEFNPQLDVNNKTQDLIVSFLNAIY